MDEAEDNNVFGDDKELSDYAQNKGWAPEKFTDVVKGYRELERKLGKRDEGMLKIPDDDATDDEWAKFNARMAPKEDYSVDVPTDLPEGVYDDEFAGVVKQIAKEAGIHDRGFKKLWDGYWNYFGRNAKSLDEKAAKIREQDEKTLREGWKTDYDKHMTDSGKAMDRFGVSEILKQVGLDGHPGIRELARFAAEHMGEDKTKGGTTSEESTEWYTEYKEIEK